MEIEILSAASQKINRYRLKPIKIQVKLQLKAVVCTAVNVQVDKIGSRFTKIIPLSGGVSRNFSLLVLITA